MNNKRDFTHWLLCPVCKSKTRIKIREDTEVKNLPLYCPKCKRETLIGIKNFQVIIITEPDTQMQSQ